MSGQGNVYKRCGCVDPVTGRQFGGRCPSWRAAVTEAGTSAWICRPGQAAAAGSGEAATGLVRLRPRCSRSCGDRGPVIRVAGC